MTDTKVRPQSPAPTPPRQAWFNAHWKLVLAVAMVLALVIGGVALLATSNQAPVGAGDAEPALIAAPAASPPTTQREIAIAEATAALEGFTADQNTVQGDPTAPLNLLDNHGKGEMVSGKPGYREDRKKGWTYIGESSLEDIEVVKVSPPNNPNRIILRTCTDITGFKVVDTKGETQYEPELERLVEVYTVTKDGGQWKVANSEALKKAGKNQSC